MKRSEMTLVCLMNMEGQDMPSIYLEMSNLSHEEIYDTVSDIEASKDSINPFRPDSEKVNMDALAFDLGIEIVE